MPELAEAALPDLGADTGVADAADGSSEAGVGTGAAQPETGNDAALDDAAGQSTSEEGVEGNQGRAEADIVGDGRTIPADIRQHFSELKAQNPALYKKLKGLFFAEREFRTHFPGGPQEALKLKQFVENVGGEEGWQGIQESLKSWEDLDGLYSNGDPQFVEKISASDPEAFGKMMPKGLEKWAELDKANYDHVMARVLFNTLGTSPIAEIYRALSADEKSKPLADKLSSWYNGIEELAQKVPQKQVDPERQKFEQEKAKWEEQRQTEFREKVGQEMRQFYSSKLDGALGAEFKARNRDLAKLKASNPKAYSAMVNDAYGRVAQQLSGDKTFVSKFEALLKEGNGKAAAQLAQARAERLIPNAAKETYNVFNLAGGAATQQKKDQTQANQQRANVPPTTKLSRQPEPHEIDWNRTDTSMVLDGKAYLKGRKEQVTF